MRSASLTVRFACELAALVAVAWCGWTITPVLGFIVPLAFAAVWGVAVAPRAKRRLPDPWRFALELVLFAAATAAFVSVDQVIVAIVFGVAAIVTAALVRIWPETLEPGSLREPGS